MAKLSKKYSSQGIDNTSYNEAFGVYKNLMFGWGGTVPVSVRVNSDGELIVSDLSNYKIADIDDTGYFGFTNKDGGWYIMKESSGAFRYIKGDSDYATSWTGRVGLSYDYFNNIF